MLKIRVLVVLAIALLANAALAAPLFRAPLRIDAGGEDSTRSAGSLVTGDFNGDGFPDVATLLQNRKLVVALNDGSGPFAPSVFSTGPATYVRYMAAGDVDGDADSDLIYVTEETLGVLRSNGDGTFTAGTSGISTSPGRVAVGDVNGDGKLDAVTTRASGNVGLNELSVHLGDGAGGFAAAVKTPHGNTSPRSLSVQDLNGDGRADVIVSYPHASAYLSGIDGTLQHAWTEEFALGPHTVGHWNGDSVVDLSIHSGNSRGPFKIFLGAGNGTFTAAGSHAIAIGSYQSALAAGDFDGDQAADLLSYGGGLGVARSRGDGSFHETLISDADFEGELGEPQVVTGDFDRDGNRDVVTMTQSNLRFVRFHFMRGNGDGTFADDRGYATDPNGGRSIGISAADMDGDGLPDVTTLLTPAVAVHQIAVQRNDGNGGLLPAVLTPTSSGTTVAFLVGSLDGDSWPDALRVDGSSGSAIATSYLGNGDGTFTTGFSRSISTAITTSSRVKLVDVTGDGALDLVIESDVYDGNGDGTFDAPRATGVLFEVVGDVDGNGTPDTIWRDDTQQRLALALNTGSGIFASPAFLGTSTETPEMLADFNGDGRLDLFAIASGATSVRLGRGDGTFHDPVVMPIGHAFTSTKWPVAADFNGDGAVDVAFGAEVLLGNGDGRFRGLDHDTQFLGIEEETYTPEYKPLDEFAAVADFDGNGSPDVVAVARAVAFVHLTRLVAEPVRPSTSTITPMRSDVYGASLPASIWVSVTGAGIPVTGTMVFLSDGVPVALGDVLVGDTTAATSLSIGQAMPALLAGTHTITATYLGSAAYLPSSASTTQTVARAATALAKSSVTGGIYGVATTIHWTLDAPTTFGLPGPATSSKFILKENGVAVPNVEWFPTHVVTKSLSAGTHTVTLDYTGDDNYLPSTTTFNVSVDKRSPMVSLEQLPAGTARVAGNVTLAAAFAVQDYGSATGSVNFFIDGASAGTAAATGVRAETTVALAAGSYALSASYSGDANNHPVVSGPVDFPVYSPPGSPPPALLATSRAGTTDLRWIPAADAASYNIYQRTSYASGWSLLSTVGTYAANVALPAGTTRMYAVAVNRAEGTGPIGPGDIATNVSFTNNPVVSGTPIRAAHISELRTAVNAVRAFAGLPAFTFTGAIAAGGSMRAVHMTELRDALTAARNAIGMPMTFSSPAPAVGVPIRASHIEEIRAGVR